MSDTNLRIAVILPCYKEEIAIAKVAHDFCLALPEAKIYVFDTTVATALKKRL